MMSEVIGKHICFSSYILLGSWLEFNLFQADKYVVSVITFTAQLLGKLGEMLFSNE